MGKVGGGEGIAEKLGDSIADQAPDIQIACIEG